VAQPQFQIQSEQAQKAVKAATSLVVWIDADPNNMEKFQNFFLALAIKMTNCFKERRSVRGSCEIMWKEYHQLRVSSSFKMDWEKFLDDAINQVPSAAFYQFVSHKMFKELVKECYVLPDVISTSSQNNSITTLEEKAIRYIAGYVCRKVMDAYLSIDPVNVHDIILFISEFSGKHVESSDRQETEEWVNSIDRGGLYHVNDDIYTIFYFMEEEVRQHFSKDSAKQLDDDTKKLSSTIDDNTGEEVFKKIVELYVNVRGHSFTSSILEQYKQKYKKKTKKSKPLRKKLQM
jgi:hypothetical protein